MKGVKGVKGVKSVNGVNGVEGMTGMGGGWVCDGKGSWKVCRVMDIEKGQGPKAKKGRLKTTSVNHYWYTCTYK